MDRARIVFEQPAPQTRRLRIAIVTETYLPEVNGVAITMGHMIAGLRHCRHDIQLIRPRQHQEEMPANEPGFEEVLVQGIPIPRYDALKLGLPAKQRLRRLWSAKRPDIVHIVTEGPLGWSALSAAHQLGLPVCTDFHTNFHTYTEHYGIGWLRKPITAYLRKFHNRSLATLVPTAAIRLELERLGLANLRVVSRGVDTILFSPRRRSPQLRASWGLGSTDMAVIYVGRIAPEKNLPLLLRAFEAMREANPRLRLVLVGDGPARAALESSHPEHVFAGMRTGEDLAAHYASGDIFLFPSTTETYGNVTMEAMASGLAVVAYDYAAAHQHIRQGVDGLLAAVDDAAGFTRLAVGLANDRGRAGHLGAHARAVAEKLDWAWVVAEFERTLLEFAPDGERYELAACSAA
ncbi:MAG TPA: glycosyltransferase family 1 protein [Burkholderiales bacterium]|nr:glycosyltransferase family 1 protein [Burkholderiales bacterium]